MTPKNKSLGLKIKWKLLAFMASFTAVIIVLLWLLQIVFLNDIYKAIKVKEIKDAASAVSNLRSLFSIDTDSEKIAQKYDICIIAYRMEDSGKATQLTSCDYLRGCLIHRLSVSDLMVFYSKAKSNGGNNLSYLCYDARTNSFIESSRSEDKDAPVSLVYSFIVKDTHGNDILYILNSTVSPLEATVKTLNYLLVIISIIMILLSCTLTVILSRKIAKPISDLSIGAKKLASGNYDVNFQYGKYREINELAQTLTFAASELKQTDVLRSELIANTSHDLRTPLTLITGYAEIMRDLPNENTPENAQVIIDEAKRLTSLVNDMLDISKLEAGTVNVNLETFNLTHQIQNELKRYSELCQREGYVINFFFDTEVTVTTDKSKLLQALFNLLNNALTYTGADKTVNVSQQTYTDMGSGQNYVRLNVIDSGEGIPEEKLDLIWDRYYKLDTPHKRSSMGSGLGLSIVQKLITLLNGRCGVMSSHHNGSIFYIEIPIK